MKSEDDPRPELARVAERVIEQETRSYRSLFTDAGRAVNEPVAGSLWHADSACARGNEVADGSLAYAVGQFQLLMRSIDNHAEALLLMMRHDRLLRTPAWAAARAVLEPVLMSCWLTQPDVSSEMRIARAASLLPGVYQGAIALLPKFPGSDEELATKKEARTDLVAYYAKHGFEVLTANKSGVSTGDITAVVYGGSRASINHNITQLAGQFLPDDPYLYGMLSGAVHSKLWVLNDISESADEAIRAIVAPLMPVSDAYTNAICGYLGLDAGPILARRATRLNALMTRGSPPRNATQRGTAFGQLQSGLRVDEIARKR
ncbi:hypothetical protein HP550_19935 [Cellulomonas humilata]|uniref:Uncharacterized protein n=1 Tax=Cellulomonas humilata TaxID=144055 RepID=A0A7Y6DZI7_9CELL|nr:hypothetical protein [Cellulomonas humilata]NUU19525.1 hypothetical protein [Cellulomonas humilata]